MSIKIKRILKSTLATVAIVMLGPLSVATAELDETVAATGLSGSFLASRVAIEDNDDDAAVRFLERTLSLDPDDSNIRQEYFAALVTNGQLEAASELVRTNKDMGSRKNLAGYVLATSEMRKRSWNKAATALKDVAGVDLDRTLRELTLAWIDAGARNFDEAYARIDDLTGPEWVQAMKHYHAGLIATVAGQGEVASQRLQTVLDNRAVISVLTETYVRALEAMVRNQVKSGQPEKAKETLAYGRSLLPNHSPFIALQSVLDKGEVPNNLIVTAQQGAAELFFNIASAIERDGVGEIAKSYFQIAANLAPKSDVILIGLAELYLRQGFFEKSNKYYASVSKASPFNRIARLEMASNLARLEQKQEAIDELKSLIAEDPSDMAGYMTLGGFYNREKRYREAADTYDAAVDQIDTIEKHHWNLFFRRGIAYERLKEWEKAEPNFKQSLELSANQPEVLNYLGYSWIDQGINLEEGVQMIRKAVELRPRSGFIVDSLGWAHYRLGQYEDAVKELERAVQLMPQDPTINDHLGDAYWKVGRKLEATFQWKIALASKTPPENVEEIEHKLANGLDEKPEDEARAE